MAKLSYTDSQPFDRTSSPATILPPPADFDMNWPEALSQSDSSIQSPTQQQQQQPFLNRLTNTACNSSSYKISIGHETVNITEMTPHRQSALSSDPTTATVSSMGSNEQRRLLNTRKGANVVSLCFMCFVSSSLILIAISTMHLLLKTDSLHPNDLLPYLLQSSNGSTNLLLSMLATPMSVTDQILPTHERTIRDLATVVCLSIVVLNCFCLLVFSIEIYLGCNMVKTRHDAHRCKYLFSSSTSRFIAICGFYASIPALILVMCLFILLHMSLIPAIISLVVLGAGLVFILMTLLTYFVTWQRTQPPFKLGKSAVSPSDLLCSLDDEIDLTKADELSTLV